MMTIIMKLLPDTKMASENINIAKGLYKFPENWSELKRYLKYKYTHK